MSKQRKVPQRKCIVTNEMKPKQSMIRIVRNKEGQVFVDPTGKQNGRGAYMTIEKQVIEKAKEDNVLAKTFQVKIDDSIYEQLMALVGDEDE